MMNSIFFINGKEYDSKSNYPEKPKLQIPTTILSQQLRHLSQYKPLFNSQKEKLSDKVKEKVKEKVTEQLHKTKELTGKITEPIKNLIPEHENIYTIPNILTFTRLITAPVIGFLIVKQQIWYSLALFTYSCITDFVDGYIARKYNMGSIVGSVIDPMADKFLMVICTACLAHAGQMPLFLAAFILGRDILLGISAIYFRYISLPPPKSVTRFFDFSIPSAEVHPTTISKYNTAFQMLYIAGAVTKPVITTLIESQYIPLLENSFDYFGYFVATTTILSGLSYVFSKNAVKILTPQKK
ncbi:hypothetical protein WICMUC_000093 [Wickerhamomyces mucosus]|uniref:Cardiolipin synthase n=1 Tax=Wickerhamomyces mucosus TaxID=1378264 RepID=A0A9P8Q0G2_9ASCO|nr:hypothetical protein WICMUC_000093 [Wickerhamomyces mucosus]